MVQLTRGDHDAQRALIWHLARRPDLASEAFALDGSEGLIRPLASAISTARSIIESEGVETFAEDALRWSDSFCASVSAEARRIATDREMLTAPFCSGWAIPAVVSNVRAGILIAEARYKLTGALERSASDLSLRDRANALGSIAQDAQAVAAEAVEALGGARTESFADALASTDSQRIETGTWIDNPLCGGLVRGDFYSMCGAPGAGKTACALQIAYETCKRGTPVIYAHGELTRKQMVLRLLSQKYERLPDELAEEIERSEQVRGVCIQDATEIESMGFRLLYCADWTPDRLAQALREMTRVQPVGVVVVDHFARLNLGIAGNNREGANRRGVQLLKNCGTEIQAAMVCLQQPKKGHEPNDPVDRSSFRETAALVEEAETSIGFWKAPDAQIGNGPPPRKFEILKGRRAQEGYSWHMRFIEESMTFREMSKDEHAVQSFTV